MHTKQQEKLPDGKLRQVGRLLVSYELGCNARNPGGQAMIIIGIDPGLSGAVGILTEAGTALLAVDTPTISIKVGGKEKRNYNTAEMVNIIREWRGWHPDCVVAMEAVHAMPGNGGVSMFSFGRGTGIWEGIIASLQIPITLVIPQRWKKAMLDGMSKDKENSRMRAIQLWPAIDFSLRKHEARAEALLVAEYVRRLNCR
jgi:crossover junction endodeoxyribonuclease RuvC